MYHGAIESMPSQLREAWATGARNHGSFEQQLATVETWGLESEAKVSVHGDESLVIALRHDHDDLKCLMVPTPWLAIADFDVNEAAGRMLAAARTPSRTGSMLYCPLVSSEPAVALRECGALAWSRRPSPAIEWTDRGQEIVDRVADRLGNRARRRWRRFNESVLQFRSLAGPDAVDAMLQIERLSWKFAAGVSLFATPQLLRFHAGALRRELTSLHSLWDGARPVAYRIDALAGRVLSCLKWSFDDRYRALSPGFALLTLGLVERWGRADIDYIDLCGSPDPLKLAIANALLPRYDVAWPADARTEALRSERQDYDAALGSAFSQGRGYRALWSPTKKPGSLDPL